ncbi:hypothetical protein VUR80DRAFT_3417 [Thermomyces stellatus]
MHAEDSTRRSQPLKKKMLPRRAETNRRPTREVSTDSSLPNLLRLDGLGSCAHTNSPHRLSLRFQVRTCLSGGDNRRRIPGSPTCRCCPRHIVVEKHGPSERKYHEVRDQLSPGLMQEAGYCLERRGEATCFFAGKDTMSPGRPRHSPALHYPLQV